MSNKELIEESFKILENITECKWPSNKRITREKLIEGLVQTEIPIHDYFEYKDSTGLYRVFSRSILDYKDLKGSINSHRNFILSFSDLFCCYNCNKFLPIELKGKNCYTCNQCLTNKYKEIKDRGNDLIYTYLIDNPCMDCGEKDPTVLEFDHRNPETKLYNISEMPKHKLDSIIKEIEKCDIVCANCHKRRTAKQQNWYKWKRYNNIKE